MTSCINQGNYIPINRVKVLERWAPYRIALFNKKYYYSLGYMPIISEFFGIKIYMYWDEHLPPHFHAEYASFKALISIKDAVVIKGQLPSRQLKLVLAWCELRENELMKNWESAQKHFELVRIDPLK